MSEQLTITAVEKLRTRLRAMSIGRSPCRRTIDCDCSLCLLEMIGETAEALSKRSRDQAIVIEALEAREFDSRHEVNMLMESVTLSEAENARLTAQLQAERRRFETAVKAQAHVENKHADVAAQLREARQEIELHRQHMSLENSALSEQQRSATILIQSLSDHELRSLLLAALASAEERK